MQNRGIDLPTLVIFRDTVPFPSLPCSVCFHVPCRANLSLTAPFLTVPYRAFVSAPVSGSGASIDDGGQRLIAGVVNEIAGVVEGGSGKLRLQRRHGSQH